MHPFCGAGNSTSWLQWDSSKCMMDLGNLRKSSNFGHTHTCTDLTHIQPLCSSPPRLGLWILFLSDRSRTEEGRMAYFLAAGGGRGGWQGGGGVEDTGWAARLTGWWGCRWGRRCRDVQGVCVCGSKDKHQWEYERLDGNLSQEVRLYHCRRNHRREADLVRLCSAASDRPSTLYRQEDTVLLCLKTRESEFFSLCANHREVVLNLCAFVNFASQCHESMKTQSL